MKEIEELQTITNRLLKELINKFDESSSLHPLFIQYDFKAYYNDTNKIPSQCNTISFFNGGDVDITIGGVFDLPVGSPMLTMGNGEKDYDTTEYKITWDTVGTNPKLVVIKRNIKGNESYFNQVTAKGFGG